MRAPFEEKQTPNGRLKAGDLMSEVVRDAQRLVSLEIELAKQELKELAMAYAVTLAMAGAGGLLSSVGRRPAPRRRAAVPSRARTRIRFQVP